MKVSISPTSYEQLLCTQIPKAKKDSQVKLLFELLGSACVKAERKYIDEIDPTSPIPGGWETLFYEYNLILNDGFLRSFFRHKKGTKYGVAEAVDLMLWNEFSGKRQKFVFS